MTTRKHDIAEAPKEPTADAEEGAPQGAPEPSAPAGEPEAPVTPSVDAEADRAPDQAVAEDHESRLEHDLELAQRTRADFENYRKRTAREAAAAQERGITKLAKELLPAVDNLDRALQAAESSAGAAGNPDGGASTDNGTATLVSGIKLVHADVIAALARAGIEGFSPEGERFDPQLHEAVAQIPVEGAESGTVVEVYQRGYRIGDVVIRPARVVVAA